VRVRVRVRLLVCVCVLLFARVCVAVLSQRLDDPFCSDSCCVRPASWPAAAAQARATKRQAAPTSKR